MAIDTHIAGEPSDIEALGFYLRSTLQSAIESQRYSLAGPLNGPSGDWQGTAGEAASDEARSLRDSADDLSAGATKAGEAIEEFGGSLRRIQSDLADIRSTARGAGLTVNGDIIEAPFLVPMTYSSEGPVPPEVTAKIEAFNKLEEAYDTALGDTEHEIGEYADACERLIDEIGTVTDDDSLLDLAKDYGPGGLEWLGKDVLPGLEGRLGDSRKVSQMLSNLDAGNTSRLYKMLFKQLEGLDDAAVLARIGELSEKSGGTLDKFLIGLSVLSRVKEGQGIDQIVLAEGGGWVAGALTTGGIWAGAGALGATPTTPIGQAAVGGVAFIIGAGVGIFTSNQIDEFYSDQEFEELITEGLKDQDRVSR